MIENAIQMLNQTWLGTVIGIIFGLTGLILACYFYRISHIGSRASYQIKSTKLIAKDELLLPDQVQILFNNSEVVRLTKNYIVFWNSGTNLLDGKNIHNEDPFRIEYGSEATILSAKKITETNKLNKFEISIDESHPNVAFLDYDYLDRNDGAVFEILHTDKAKSPKVCGTIKGLTKRILNWGIIRDYERDNRQNSKKKSKYPILQRLLFGLFAAIILPFFIIFWLAMNLTIFSSNAPLYASILLLALFDGMPVYILYDKWRNRRRFPKELYFEDLFN